MAVTDVHKESAQSILGLNVSNANILVAFLGTFLSVFGLVSYLLKEKFYLSEACRCMRVAAGANCSS